jgi:hypothetical protein
MWGKTLWKGKPVHDEYIEPEQLEQYIEEHPLIYSHRRSGTKIRARLIKPVYQPWQRPQFGIVVMSHGRVVMQDAIYRAVDDGIDVYYCNTDSLLIKREDLSRIRIPLGDKLGEFHMEYEMKKFICLSPKRYVRVFHDDTFQNAFGKRDVEWFEEEYSRMLQSVNS